MYLLSLYWCFKIKVKQKVYFLNDQLFTKNWIGFMYQYDQRVTFKLKVLVGLVLVQKKLVISLNPITYWVLGIDSIPNEKFDYFIQKFKLYYPEPLQYRYNTRQLHVFFNKPELETNCFWLYLCGFTCFELKIVFVMILRTLFGSQQVNHRN